MEYSHITRDGTRIPLGQLTDSHLMNIMRFLVRRSKDGVVIAFGDWCGAGDVDEIWFDEDVIYGKEALNYLNYNIYMDEAKRRGLVIGT